MENAAAMKAEGRAMGADPQMANATCHQVPLSFLRSGEEARVVKVRGKEELQRHLETLGFRQHDRRGEGNPGRPQPAGGDEGHHLGFGLGLRTPRRAERAAIKALAPAVLAAPGWVRGLRGRCDGCRQTIGKETWKWQKPL